MPYPRSSFFFVVGGIFAMLSAGCECSPPAPGDAGSDAALPPGDPGLILGVPEVAAQSIPGLEGEVYVVYTELGVPHVYAASEHDLRVVQGYLLARDRYFQIDLIRRFGLGELGGLLGTPGFQIDVLSRSQGMTEVVEHLLEQLTPEQMEMHQAFADGVNAYVRASQAGMVAAPSEFNTLRGILGARRASDLLEELEVRDLMGFATGVVWQLGFTTTDLDVTTASAGVAAQFAGDPFATERTDGVLIDLLRRLDPVHDTTSVECASPPCFGLDGTAPSMALAPSFFAPPSTPTIEPGMASALRARLAQAAFLRGGIGVDFGSNAWAVGTGATADGAGILAGDGHLPLSVSALFYQMGLDTTVFEGADPRRQMGLFFAGIVPMAVGTNGHVAWSQTYQEADAVDWYREELVLDGSGRPMATMFGEPATPQPLTAIDETELVRRVDVLMSMERTETWQRYVTFDGRHLTAIEGRPAEGVTPGAGESVVNVSGTAVIPGDVDGDGVISAISLDFIAFEVTNLLQMADDFGRSNDVAEFRAATRRNVAYTQNLAVADEHGGILYTAYSGYPCRDHLRPAGMSTGWAVGADPLRVIDGTRYGGFEIPVDAMGRPSEAAGSGAPNECLVPEAMWPESMNPTRGFVLTANNDIAGTSLDGDVSNDAFYLGGTYAEGYRASTIRRNLEALAATAGASIETMAALQGDHVSRTLEDYFPALEAAVEAARDASAIAPAMRSEDEARLASIYEADEEAIFQAMTRLTSWHDGPHIAQSGVVTFYDPDAELDADDAAATMIWAETFRRILDRILSDEDIDDVMAHDPRTLRANVLRRLIEGRGPGNPESLASYNPATEESVFFDVRGTAPVERSEEALVGALADALDALTAPPTETEPLGFGSMDMGTWRWGLRHMVRFESILVIFAGSDVPEVGLLAGGFSISPRRLPIAEMIPVGDPRADLPWYPRPGDFFAVDAANAPLTLGADYTYGNGPVMRMVIELREGSVRGQNILPGGQSGITTSEHYDDQARLWLANETIPLRFSPADVVMGATGRETFRP